MKNQFFIGVLAALACATTVVAAQPFPLQYSQMVAETHRLERLEGSEYMISKDLLFKRVRLDLKPFGGGSDALYANKRDEVGFICIPALKGFKGGWVEGRIERHEPGAEGGHFFTLSDCRRVEQSRAGGTSPMPK